MSESGGPAPGSPPAVRGRDGGDRGFRALVRNFLRTLTPRKAATVWAEGARAAAARNGLRVDDFVVS